MVLSEGLVGKGEWNGGSRGWAKGGMIGWTRCVGPKAGLRNHLLPAHVLLAHKHVPAPTVEDAAGHLKLRLPSRFAPGSVKAAAWQVLAEVPPCGMAIGEIARRIQVGAVACGLSVFLVPACWDLTPTGL